MCKTAASTTLHAAIALAFAMALAVAAGQLGAGAAFAEEGPDAAADGAGAPAATVLSAQYSSFTTATTAPSFKPTNALSSYEVYSTYLFFTIGLDNNLINYNLYMDICPVGKKWSKGKTWEFGTYVKTYTVKGLKPNTTYKARLYYGVTKSVKGPYSKTVKFTTGPKSKPAVQSVKVQAISLSKHYQRIYGYYTGVYMGKRAYYTYKLRTTVTLKKVPKLKYITVNGKKFKANKKTYTVTTKKLVRYDTSPRGTKYTATAATYRNKKWKGYSLLYSKSCKIQ